MFVLLQPAGVSKEYPPLTADMLFGRSLPFGLNYTFFALQTRLFAAGIKEDIPIQEFRKAIGLQAVTGNAIFEVAYDPPGLTCIAVSEHLFSRPNDWTEERVVCGPLMLSPKEQVANMA